MNGSSVNLGSVCVSEICRLFAYVRIPTSLFDRVPLRCGDDTGANMVRNAESIAGSYSKTDWSVARL